MTGRSNNRPPWLLFSGWGHSLNLWIYDFVVQQLNGIFEQFHCTCGNGSHQRPSDLRCWITAGAEPSCNAWFPYERALRNKQQRPPMRRGRRSWRQGFFPFCFHSHSLPATWLPHRLYLGSSSSGLAARELRILLFAHFLSLFIIHSDLLVEKTKPTEQC